MPRKRALPLLAEDENEGGVSKKSRRNVRSRTLGQSIGQFIDTEKNDKFCKGNIVRVYMENFMTYHHAQFYPQPGLNIVLGVNGSGKSAIMNGVMLALGASMKSLDRGSSLRGYVKDRKDHAVLEIELYKGSSNGRNLIIRREITIKAEKSKEHAEEGERKGKKYSESSTWKVNNAKKDKAYVTRLVKSIGIHVDNLFHFVPQQYLNNFPSLSEYDKLRSFESAFMEDGSLGLRHDQLIEMQKEFLELEAQLKAAQDRLNEVKRVLDTQRKDRLRYEERLKHLTVLTLLKQKRPWLEYNTHLKRVEESKKALAEFEKERDSRVKDMEKIEQKMKSLEKKRARHLEEEKLHKRSHTTNRIRVKNQQKRLHDQQLDVAMKRKDVSSLEEELKQHTEDVSKLRMDIKTIEDRLASFESETDLENKDRELSEWMRRISKDTNRIQHGKREINNRSHSLDAEERKARDKQAALSNIPKIRLENLASKQPYIRQIANYIRGKRFSSDVYFPVACYIQMKYERYGGVLEKLMGYETLRSAICSNRNDYDMMMRDLYSQQRLPVSIFHVTEVREPIRLLPSDLMRRYGIEFWLDEVFDAPIIVKQALILKHQIDKIAVGTEIRNSDELFERGVSRVYSGSYFYISAKSKYDGSISSLSDFVRESRVLVGHAKQEEIEQCEKEIAEIQHQKTDLRQRDQELSDEHRRIMQENDKVRAEKSKIARKLSEKNGVVATLKVKRMQLNSRMKGGDAEKVKEQYIRKIKELNIERFEKSKSVAKDIDNHISNLCSLCDAQIQREEADMAYFKLEPNYSRMANEKTRLCRNAQLEADRISFMAGELNRLHEIAKSAVQMSDELKGKFEELPETIEEIDEKTHQEEVYIKRLSLASGGSSAADHEKLLEEADTLETDFSEKNRKYEELQSKIEEVKKGWLEELESCTKDLSDFFSTSMRAIGFAGEIKITKPKSASFLEFGLSAKATFRNREGFREFNAAGFSGGERALCTALMLCSLQRMKRFPVAFYDELNQGMDEQNETYMISRFEDMESEFTTQTFLISPKLPPALRFNDKTSIHFIINSPSMK